MTTSADAEQLPQADPRREQARESAVNPADKPRDRAQLSGGRDRDVEVGATPGAPE